MKEPCFTHRTINCDLCEPVDILIKPEVSRANALALAVGALEYVKSDLRRVECVKLVDETLSAIKAMAVNP